MDKVQQIISWFNNYNGKSVRIVSESKDFYINIDNSMLPHLLGLHYIRRDTKILKGNQLLKYIVDNKLSDADIITRGVLRNHGTNVANNVQQRIDTFRDFMENIERARIVENTNPNTRIRSSYLAIDNPENQDIRHLAILDTGDVDIILDYDVNTLETYIVQGNDNYYSNTTIDEPIKELLFYNEERDMWYKGSFNLQRNKELEKEQNINAALSIDKSSLSFGNNYNEKFNSTVSDLNSAIDNISNSIYSYMDFLDTASNLYKYHFYNQALIYSADKDIKTAATFDEYKRVNRIVIRGHKGIPLFSNSGKLKYVFNVKDTTVMNGKTDLIPERWELSSEKKNSLKKYLENLYNAKGNDLVEVIKQIALEKTAFSLENEKDLCAFASTYSVLKRCGFDRDDIVSYFSDKLNTFNQFNIKSLIHIYIEVAKISREILENAGSYVLSNFDKNETAEKVRGETKENKIDGEQITIGSILTNSENSKVDMKEVDKASFSFYENEQKEEIYKSSLSSDKSDAIEVEKNGLDNFRITEEILPEKLSPSERLNHNMEAISMLNRVEKGERKLDIKAQEVLAKYVGWGGLADVFDDKKEGQWKIAREFLKTNLSEEEYKNARASTLTAFYTPKKIIDGMYRAILSFGFDKGKILEPSFGVGGFLGLLPDNLKDSKFYGTELDSVSGRIGKLLYPNSYIEVSGFEKKKYANSYFDLAIGNVPFGDIKIYDSEYKNSNYLIHDYFFMKSIDKLKAGGILAFISSKGTLDKQNKAFRKEISRKVNFIGAIRLPNNMFKGVAGTEITSDIIFMQKKEDLSDEQANPFIELKKDANGIYINEYFVNHPEMIIGEMREISGRFGTDAACILDDTYNFNEMFYNAIEILPKDIIKDTEIKSEMDEEISENGVDISNIDNFSFIKDSSGIYFIENGVKEKVSGGDVKLDRISKLIDIRDILKDLIHAQVEGIDDENLLLKQNALKEVYSKYFKKYGSLNLRGSSMYFSDDISYPLLCSLEKLDDDGNVIALADIFTKRTIEAETKIMHCDTSYEALLVTLNDKGFVDLGHIEMLTQSTREEILAELDGTAIFENFEKDNYVTADEFLSGNIREKLYKAKNIVGYSKYIKQLEAVMPKDLTASEVSVKLGSAWLDPKYIKDFIEYLLEPSYYALSNIKIHYSQTLNKWSIKNKSVDNYNLLAISTYGTEDRSAYDIIETTLNLSAPKVTRADPTDDKKRIPDKKATQLALAKQELIIEKFNSWIFSDIDRRNEIVKTYNEKFNHTVNRKYDGTYLTFPNMNSNIKLYDHQKNVVARQLFGGNTLLAHVVGAGKTYSMIAGIMEAKRLGLSNKAMVVVPNHLIEQWASEFMELYPLAKILVSTKKDFSPKNRKKFCSKIATGNWDAVIIGHSQFEKLGMSEEFVEEFYKSKIEEFENAIAELKGTEEEYSIKEIETQIRNYKTLLEKLSNKDYKDNVLSFEELGIDRLCVDEAHSYKNLYIKTKLRNLSGFSNTSAKKSFDLLMKCEYLNQKTNYKGVIFATGTPVSNSLTELYTMQTYLQKDKLIANGFPSFDEWISTFGVIKTRLELNVLATGFKQRTRLIKYDNLPELMKLFHECADVKTADVLNLNVPKAEYHNIELEPTPIQTSLYHKLAERVTAIENRLVDSAEDNMLTITNDGRKIALDERILDETFEVISSKSAKCIEIAYNKYLESMEEKAAQLIFCDLSVPKKSGQFNVYDELKQLLLKKGVSEDEIAFIHDANTDIKKAKLFRQVKEGSVRFLIGSTEKMGAGMNVQKKLIALHHIDVPWRPSDLEQREGRIIRQGNMFDNVHIYRYITKGTFDAYSWQTIETKTGFTKQIMTSKTPLRSGEAIEESELAASTAKALAIGNPLIKEKAELENDINRLKTLKSGFLDEKYRLEDNVYRVLPANIMHYHKVIEKIRLDYEYRKNSLNKDFEITVRGISYDNKKEGGEALLQALKTTPKEKRAKLGIYNGFEIYSKAVSIFDATRCIELVKNYTYPVEIGIDALGNIMRINNALDKMDTLLENFEISLKQAQANLKNAENEIGKTFEYEKELEAKMTRLSEVDILLEENENAEDMIDTESIRENYRNMVSENIKQIIGLEAEEVKTEALELLENEVKENQKDFSARDIEIIGEFAHGIKSSNIKILIAYTGDNLDEYGHHIKELSSGYVVEYELLNIYRASNSFEEILSADFDVEYLSSEYKVNQDVLSETELNKEDFLER